MLGWALLGGERPPLPWEFFVALGGAIVVVCPVLFVALYPWWKSTPILGDLEVAVFGVVGAGLLIAGLIRRAKSTRSGPTPAPAAPPHRW